MKVAPPTNSEARPCIFQHSFNKGFFFHIYFLLTHVRWIRYHRIQSRQFDPAPWLARTSRQLAKLLARREMEKVPSGYTRIVSLLVYFPCREVKSGKMCGIEGNVAPEQL